MTQISENNPVNIPETISPAQQLSRCLRDCQDCVFTFHFQQYYLSESPMIRLLAVVAWRNSGMPVVVVTEKVDDALRWISDNVRGDTVAGQDIDEFAHDLGAAVVPLKEPWKLSPVYIAKPWGQEIWYTGIEERGLSSITDGFHQTPLPWLLALGSDLLLSAGIKEPNLLKVLDPLPEEVFGDLYFELHEQKQEVYVVTGVSQGSQRRGEGAIRYGFSPLKRQAYDHDDAFRSAYLSTVKCYESIRRQIDGLMDEYRADEGIGVNAPVEVGRLKYWLSKLPEALLAEEAMARQAMDDFTHLVPVSVGDAIKIDCLIPHALQHGVRAVEFQTPVYERKILSFAQKVLTQNHWDIDEAVQLMRLDPGAIEQLVLVEKTPDFCVEQVVGFEDFNVYRLTIKPGGKYSFPCRGSYFLLMMVAGQITIESDVLAPEQALLFPATLLSGECINSGRVDAIFLISAPFVL